MKDEALAECRKALECLVYMRTGLYSHPMGSAIDTLAKHLPELLDKPYTPEGLEEPAFTIRVYPAEPEFNKRLDFKDFDCVIPSRGYLLRWTYLGEGFEGDYDEDDEHDTPFLRADLHTVNGRKISDEAKYSYCTLAPTWTPKKELLRMASRLLHALPSDPTDQVRGIMERWTHDTAYVTPRKEDTNE